MSSDAKRVASSWGSHSLHEDVDDLLSQLPSVSSDHIPTCNGPTRAVACNVMSVEELQHVVSLLPPEELDRFSKWFEEFLADQWDRRIEADILAGRLDEVGRRADEDFESGRCTPLS
jgi:hypothetical protein